MLTYIPSMEHAIHEVTFRNTEIRDMLINRFPILNRMGVIDTAKLNSALNKEKDPDVLQLRLKGDSPIIELYCTEKREEVPYEPIEVGTLLEQDVVERYRNLVESYLNRKQWDEEHPMVTHPVELSKVDRSGVTLVPVTNKPIDSLQSVYLVHVPIRDGLSTVSVAEYARKLPQPGTLELIVCYDNRHSLKTVNRYRDALIKVISVQPSALWFPLPTEQRKAILCNDK